jgi:hypothetical protein
MNSKSFDKCRREIGRELLLKRQQDDDHSEERLFIDAQILDSKLISFGYELIYQTEWSRKRNLKLLQADISDLNSKDMLEVSND